MEYDSLLQLVQKRRSVRKFKPDPIPADYIDKIIEVARWAPSAANSQPWEFIVIKKEKVRDAIIDLIKENNDFVKKIELIRKPATRYKWVAPGYVRAPVFIILCGDSRTKEAYPLRAVLERGTSHFTSSLANCFLYMNLAATALGLGSQWVSAIAFNYVQTLVKQLLQVPKEIEFYDMMAVGYPDIEPKPRLVRNKEELIHYDRYDKIKFRSEKAVQDFVASLRK